jgi:RNA polymerase sigma-70 factor, ECF subfamily
MPDERADLVLLPPGRHAGPPREPADFEDFYREWWTRIRASIVINGLADPAAAEDITQDAFGEALEWWERVGRYDEPQAWVRKVARRKAIDRWRGRRMEVHEDPPDTIAMDDATADTAIGEMALARALELIRGMPPRRRQVLMLYFLEGWTAEQVASMLGMTAATVRGHVFAGRHQLLRLMNPPYREELT